LTLADLLPHFIDYATLRRRYTDRLIPASMAAVSPYAELSATPRGADIYSCFSRCHAIFSLLDAAFADFHFYFR